MVWISPGQLRPSLLWIGFGPFALVLSLGMRLLVRPGVGLSDRSPAWLGSVLTSPKWAWHNKFEVGQAWLSPYWACVLHLIGPGHA